MTNSDDVTEVNVIIEISQNSGEVKYETNENNTLVVNRFLPTSMRYPCNYGFIPHTHASDNDSLDALVITRYAVMPGAMIRTKIIGVLEMTDEDGEDNKILCVPSSKIDSYYADIKDYIDIPFIELQRITHFFQHYKDLESEKNKYIKIGKWLHKEQAEAILRQAIQNS